MTRPSDVEVVPDSEDFGDLLCPAGSDVFWNIWSADYEEAREIREKNGGYLLAYRRHFFVVEGGYIEFLGLDPADPDWDAIGRDWARPADPAARRRLEEQLMKAEKSSA